MGDDVLDSALDDLIEEELMKSLEKDVSKGSSAASAGAMGGGSRAGNVDEMMRLMQGEFGEGTRLPDGRVVPPGQRAVMSHLPVGFYSKDLPDFGDGDWITIYPLYMDAEKGAHKGRRIGLEYCRKDIAAHELSLAIWSSCKLPCVTEFLKSHPRDGNLKNGRVRVKLRTKGQPTNPLYPTKIALLKCCAAALDNVPERKLRLEALAAKRAEQAIALEEAAANEKSKSAQPQPSSNKSGKKKR